MKQSKCRSTDDGMASCVVSVMGQRCTCPDEAVASPSLPASEHSTTRKAQSKQHTSLRWKTIRSGLLFVLACLTSPCCTPLFVPLGLALLAGTPLALWLTAYLGWVYGAFTLVCVSSLVFAFRPLRKRFERISVHSLHSSPLQVRPVLVRKSPDAFSLDPTQDMI